jgi:hypothetical protein
MIGNVELNPGPETYISSSPPNLDNSSNDNSISLCNINIRSIRNKTNFVQHFADEFDILVITESHLDNSIQNDDIELYSFTKNIQRRDRQNQTGGGLLIYTKENVNLKMELSLALLTKLGGERNRSVSGSGFSSTLPIIKMK